MKKFLLVAVAALAVVACKKDNDNNGGEQPTPPTPQVETNPYIVNFEYPKTIVTQEGAGVSTLTHTVTDRLLRESVYTSAYGSVETCTFTYNSENYLTKAVQKSSGQNTPTTVELFYNNKKQVERVVETGAWGDVTSYAFTYNEQGEVSKEIRVGGGATSTTQFAYQGTSVVATRVEVRDNGGGSFSTTTNYTLDSKGNVTKEEYNGYVQNFTYTNGANYNGRGAFAFIAPEVTSVAFRQINFHYYKRFVNVAQKNFPKTSSTVREYVYNNENKPTQIVIKSTDGRTATQTLTY